MSGIAKLLEVVNLIFEASTTPAVEQAVAQSAEAMRHCEPAMANNSIKITTAAGRNGYCGQS